MFELDISTIWTVDLQWGMMIFKKYGSFDIEIAISIVNAVIWQKLSSRVGKSSKRKATFHQILPNNANTHGRSLGGAIGGPPKEIKVHTKKILVSKFSKIGLNFFSYILLINIDYIKRLSTV